MQKRTSSAPYSIPGCHFSLCEPWWNLLCWFCKPCSCSVLDPMVLKSFLPFFCRILQAPLKVWLCFSASVSPTLCPFHMCGIVFISTLCQLWMNSLICQRVLWWSSLSSGGTGLKEGGKCLRNRNRPAARGEDKSRKPYSAWVIISVAESG